MVNERLIWWAEKKKILHHLQNGFRRGRSCAENLVKIVADIRSSIYNNEYTLVAFLDVTSAYDNVDFGIMINKLLEEKCPSNILKYIYNWLQFRETEFIVNSQCSVHRNVGKGLPQGAVLSPLLYAIYINKITHRLEEDIKILQFADDISVYIIGSNKEDNRIKLEVAVNMIAKNLNKIGLSLKPNKTKLVEFSKSGFCDKKQYIKIKGTRVPN